MWELLGWMASSEHIWLEGVYSPADCNSQCSFKFVWNIQSVTKPVLSFCLFMHSPIIYCSLVSIPFCHSIWRCLNLDFFFPPHLTGFLSTVSSTRTEWSFSCRSNQMALHCLWSKELRRVKALYTSAWICLANFFSSSSSVPSGFSFAVLNFSFCSFICLECPSPILYLLKSLDFWNPAYITLSI